jgi:DivIVA domain-containing protein
MAHLTPDDVHRIAFRKPAFGKRGYDEEEVDAFLDEVQNTLTALYDEIARLRGGGVPVAAAPEPTPRHTASGDLDDVKATLARIEARLNSSPPPQGGAFF